MSFYRKKPVVIEAVQFTGKNDAECLAFCPIARDPVDNKPNLIIPTLEGEMLVSVGDYIIKGVADEFYPCKPDIFAQTYEEVPLAEISLKVIDLGDDETEAAFLEQLRIDGV